MMEGGGDENHVRKNRKRRQGVEKCLKCGRDKSPSQVNRHQATRPSHSTNLVRQLAMWTRLYIFPTIPLQFLSISPKNYAKFFTEINFKKIFP